MTDNQEKMLSLLDKAYQEGVDSTAEKYEVKIADMVHEANSNLAEAVKDAKAEAYRQGCADTLKSVGVEAKTEDEVVITNPIVREYFASLPKGGYSQTDVSRMRYFAPRYNRGSSKKNMADRGNPYVVYCYGDELYLECAGEPIQVIKPSNGYFECYNLLPNKTYSWNVVKGGKTIKTGQFKTIGDVRLVQIPTFPNMRDIAYPPMKYNRVLSAANPDGVEIGSDDYNTILSLGIDTQINLREPDADSSTERAWRGDIFDHGYNIDIAAYASIVTNPYGWKKAIETLIDELEKGHRVVFNCFAGADRTGCLRYVLQGLCGVPRHIAHGFYELTSLMWWENYKYYDDESDNGGLRKLDRLLATKFGDNFQEQCYRLLNEVVGLTKDQIAKLISLLCD